MVFAKQLIKYTYILVPRCNYISRNFITSNRNCQSDVRVKDEIELPHYMHLHQVEDNKIELLHSLIPNMTVVENFITAAEEESLMKELEPILRRKRYEFDHWDEAIHGFRETEYKEWNNDNKNILQRVQEAAFSNDSKADVLEHVHVLDLSKDGKINPHVDSIRFCGHTIAGLSLISDSVMRLIRTQETDKNDIAKDPNITKNLLSVDVLLKRRSLYIMRHIARYNFTHEILDKANSIFKNEIIPRERRVSVICRNHPK